MICIESQSNTTDSTLSNGLLSQHNDNPADLYTLMEIAQRLDVTYERLRGFAEAPGVKEAVGAVKARGAKGHRYPATAFDLFALLIRAQDEGLLQPVTAGAWLARTRRDEPGEAIGLLSQPNDRTLLPVAQLPEAQVVPILVAAIKQAAREIIEEQRVLPPPDDCLLTSDQAATILACSPKRINKYVKSVRRGRWRRSDVLNFIRSL